MKKLMIAAAIVCAAAFAQAASLNWSLSSKNTIKYLTDGSGDASSSIVCYLMDTKGSDYETFVSDLAKGTANASSITGYSSYLQQGTTGTSGAKLGKLASPTAATVATPGKDYTCVFVAFGKDTLGKDVYYLSGEQTGKSFDGSPDYPTGTAASWSSYNADNWKSVSSVPEPTSAMLLLLGVAGLALKRKRA
mgnify:CR=1 FL=1